MMLGMIAVIIAGGAGTRLWPLSTPEYPKHLLRVNENRSLLQSAYRRAEQLSDAIYVVTEAGHAHHVREQLPEVTDDACIIEPARRNTAACLLAALYKVRADGHKRDEPIAILWADHFIRDVDGFAQSFRIAGEASAKSNRVALVGIEPTYASTGFGYIQKGKRFDDTNLVYEVASFTEKPPFDQARQYVRSGKYLWNGGYLVGTLDAFEAAMQRDCPELWADYQSLLNTKTPKAYQQAYLALDNTALDYRFNEKVRDLLVVPASFDWMDLGSFHDMYEAVDHDEAGNHVQGMAELEGVENSFVYNDTDKPVAVIGLDNVVVVQTPHGTLVARKDLSQAVGTVSKRFKQQGN